MSILRLATLRHLFPLAASGAATALLVACGGAAPAAPAAATSSTSGSAASALQLDPAKRLEAVKAVEQYVLQKAYVAPIATDWILVAANAKVKGYEWDAIGYPMLTDVWLAP
jgi:MarR-like DNA-binding transcriptional regulator SgrR of sgrS sRNA